MDELWSPRALGRAYSRQLVESYFLKLNAPDGQRAVWVKYTFLRPAEGGSPVGECWVIRFDRGPKGSGVTAVKNTWPLEDCRFDASSGDVFVAHNRLTPTSASGQLSEGTAFQVDFQSPPPPFRLLPDALYSDLVPTTKLSTQVPSCLLSGYVDFAGDRWSLDGWTGSMGHNWGRKHTSRYVWGQIAGKWSGRPLFFEGFSVPISPTSGPSACLSMGRLHLGEQQFLFHGPYCVLHNQSVLNLGRDWTFQFTNREYRLSGSLSFRSNEAVAALRYIQPSGTVLSCLNSMVADASLSLWQRGKSGSGLQMEEEFQGTAALEFLTPNLDHGFRMLV